MTYLDPLNGSLVGSDPTKVSKTGDTMSGSLTVTSGSLYAYLATSPTSINAAGTFRQDAAASYQPALQLQNLGGGAGSSTGIDFATYNSTVNEAAIRALDGGNFSAHILFLTKTPGSASNTQSERFRILMGGGIKVTGGYADLTTAGATAGSNISSSLGDKIALWENGTQSNAYGVGIQGGRMVLYVGSGGGVAVRTTSGSGNASSGSDAIVLFANGTIQSTGGRIIHRTTVADAAYTILATDHLIALTSITAARTFTLPSAASVSAGTEFRIKDESGSVSATNTLTIATTLSQKIDGATSLVLSSAYASTRLYSNGANWFTW